MTNLKTRITKLEALRGKIKSAILTPLPDGRYTWDQYEDLGPLTLDEIRAACGDPHQVLLIWDKPTPEVDKP